MKLHVAAFALTCAVLWGAGLFVLTWWIIAFEGPAPADAPPPFLGLVYRGYQFTAAGSVVGAGWAFVDGLIGGAVFAWLYNWIAARRGGTGST